MVKEALRFGLPLLPHTLSHWALQLADRLVLSALVTIASVGIYGLAANLAVPLMVAVLSLNHGLMPQYALVGKEPGRLDSLGNLLRVQVGVICVMTLAVALMAGPFISLMVNQQFASASGLVPWLALGYGFLGLYCIPMNSAALIIGRTSRIWTIAPAAALVNVAVILLFVPDDGLVFAAIASAAGYAVLLVGTYLYARHHADPITYPWSMMAGVCGVAGLGYAIGATALGEATVLDAAFRFGWLAACTAVIATIVGPSRLRSLW